MNFFESLHSPFGARVRSPTKSPTIIQTGAAMGGVILTDAEKLSAVYSSIDIRSGDIASLPDYVFNRFSKDRDSKHPILLLLNVRPNVMMTPFVRRKLLEYSILTTGEACDWIIRDPITRRPAELIPLPGTLFKRVFDNYRNIWYQVTDPITKELFYIPQEDICDYKDATHDGINGITPLTYARDVVQSGLAAQTYNRAFYENGGQPSGILMYDQPLSDVEYDANGKPTGRTIKDTLREEWEKNQGGPMNAHKIAILDYGLKYQPLGISQKDAMFVEQQKLTVEDIARFFKMPPYKIAAGKQSYNSNQQQAIEYAGFLRPSIIQREQEMTYKLLTPSELEEGWEIRANMMALLRSNDEARANYYRTMKEVGAYSVDDILALEDMPAVPGGNLHQASLNYVPLELWEQLSLLRNGGKEKTEE